MVAIDHRRLSDWFLKDRFPLIDESLDFRVKRDLANEWAYIKTSVHLNSSHILVAPPEEGVKSSPWHLQLGQTKPLMFSTTPIMGIPVLTQKLSSFLTSASATY
jgi:hypothetical protein